LLIDLLNLAFGIAALAWGGYLVVEGASSLARILGVSQLVVGLTVVAFGTSAPELSVNLLAAVEGETDLAFGNVIGSNIANIGLILGLAAVVRNLDIQSQLITRELPMLLLATTAAALMALDPLLAGTPAEYDRGDGLLLLLFFTVFMYGIVREWWQGRHEDSLVRSSGATRRATPRWPAVKSVGICLVGLTVLIVGGEAAVSGATGLALVAGVPPAVIGLSVVAVGTSLPELVTSLVAAIRGNADIAVGNIVGSNIFNLLFVLGLTACLRPTPVPPSGLVDIAALVFFAFLLVPISLARGRCIVRTEGWILLVLWGGYIAMRYALLG
jgi:cation:H+ antiporter